MFFFSLLRVSLSKNFKAAAVKRTRMALTDNYPAKIFVHSFLLLLYCSFSANRRQRDGFVIIVNVNACTAFASVT